MTANENTSGKKDYRVYATDVLFRDVQAESAEEAYRIAEDDPCFETCDSGLRLDADVKDLETGEFIRVGTANGNAHCKTCDCEIVEGINESFFYEGHCGLCEYKRYGAYDTLLSTMDLVDYCIEEGALRPCYSARKLRDAVSQALKHVYGKSS